MKRTKQFTDRGQRSDVRPFCVWKLNLPWWMNSRKDKHCQNNIQAVRWEGEGGCVFTNVMDKGMTHRLIIVGVRLHERKYSLLNDCWFFWPAKNTIACIQNKRAILTCTNSTARWEKSQQYKNESVSLWTKEPWACSGATCNLAR